MSFVHGHSRDTGGDPTWVRSHHRAPHHPDDGQLVLPADDAPEETEEVAVEKALSPATRSSP